VSNPLSLVPLAAAAGNGRVDEYETQQLVAAGLTLLQRSAPLVRALSGRRSAILLPTSPAFFVALAASDGRGAVFINPLAAPAEIAYQIEDAGVGAVFTNAALASRLPPDMPRVLLDDMPRHAQVYVNGIWNSVDLGSHRGLHLEGEHGVAGRDEEAAVVYTSAMAGRPLGAILSHRNLLANARATIETARCDANDHSLAVLPLAHLFGFTVTAIAPLLAGGRVTTVERLHPLKVVDALEMTGITMLVAVPAVFLALLAALERRDRRLHADALRLCICGGAVLRPEIQDRWFDATGVELRQGYGLTEASPVCLFNPIGRPNRRGALGTALPGVEVEIKDPSSASTLGPDAIGEICVRGENVFRGYVGNATAGLTVRDGWLHTGDLGSMSADGTVTFRGLIKPMFTRNGFNIYPREIERVVLELPGVRAVAVRARPDEAKENDIALDVAGDVSVDEVRQWCEARLSAYKQPSEIMVT
jgi:long-chain acyl-CoA synthetase